MSRRAALVLALLALLVAISVRPVRATPGCASFPMYIIAEDVACVLHSYVNSADPPLSSLMTMHRERTLFPVRSLSLPALRRAHSIATSSDYNTLWVTCPGSNDVTVICARTCELLTSFNFGDIVLEGMMGIASRPETSEVWVMMHDTGKVVIFDASVPSLVTAFSVGGTPSFVSFNQDGSKAFVVSDTTGEVIAIRAWDRAVLATIPLGGGALGDAVMSPDGGRLYVANEDLDRVEVISPVDYSVFDPLVSGSNPRGIAISRDGQYLFVGHAVGAGSSYVAMIRLADGAVVSTLDGFTDPRRIAVPFLHDRVLVVDHEQDELVAINVNRGTERLVRARVSDLDIGAPPGQKASPIGLVVSAFEIPFCMVKINGISAPEIELTRADDAVLSLSVYDSFPGAGEADWWLMAMRGRPTGGYPDRLWFWTPTTFWGLTPLPMHQGPVETIVDFSSPPVPLARAPLGAYTFILAVDLERDGRFSFRSAYYRYMTLVVTE